MHHPKLLRAVHGVHHRARNPSALESFYQHPIELLSGLSLMFFATWLIGPVHVYTFAATFFVYSTFNIIVHAGFQARLWIFAPFDFLIRKHHMHHAADPGKNYSSLTPLPDLLFGTSG
jgi:sterol desaturase/sphingolipid hydroxylase (fatty acid hydroxylase superfamily)